MVEGLRVSVDEEGGTDESSQDEPLTFFIKGRRKFFLQNVEANEVVEFIFKDSGLVDNERPWRLFGSFFEDKGCAFIESQVICWRSWRVQKVL